MLNLNNLKTLIRREFWEHRGAFIKAPIIVSIVGLVILIGLYITSLVLTHKTGSQNITNTGLRELANLHPDKLKLFWDAQLTGSSTMYLVILFFVLFFFLLGSLFDDRKDGSILFWKSLPITDANTVISKLITAMVFVPLSFIVIAQIAMFINMLVSSIILLIHGHNPITLVWSPASLFNSTKVMIAGAITQMVWALPVYGWLIFSSSISKRRPFLFATFIPAIIAFSLYWINMLSFKFTNIDMFKIPANHLGHALLPFASSAMNGKSFSFNPDKGSAGLVSSMFSNLATMQVLYGVIFCAIMVSAAIWVRRYRNTT